MKLPRVWHNCCTIYLLVCSVVFIVLPGVAGEKRIMISKKVTAL